MIHASIRLPFRCQPVSVQRYKQPSRRDDRQTALREATYIRRTRFVKGSVALHDFSLRGEDLGMLVPILPADAPKWVRSPFMRWQRADDAAEATGRADEVRAWHVCGDLRPGLTRGEWLDQTERMVRSSLPAEAVGEIVIHLPSDKPPHAHLLVAPRFIAREQGYGPICFQLYDALNDALRGAWTEWLKG